MAFKHASNGGYRGNFKNKGEYAAKNEESDGDEENNAAREKATEYLKELLSEKLQLDQDKLPYAARLLEQEITKAQEARRRGPPRNDKFVDLYRDKPVKVTVKALVPVIEHPRFNFVGKILGTKGSTMKSLQEETMCRLAILGKGSIKDRQKEEELRNSLDPKYSHLQDELHVEISALGPPAEAHARIAYALSEIQKYLIPDDDHMGQGQMSEMDTMGGYLEEERPRRPPPRYNRNAEEGYGGGYEDESYASPAQFKPRGYSAAYEPEYEEEYYEQAAPSWKAPFKPAGGPRYENTRYRGAPYSRGSR